MTPLPPLQKRAADVSGPPGSSKQTSRQSLSLQILHCCLDHHPSIDLMMMMMMPQSSFSPTGSSLPGLHLPPPLRGGRGEPPSWLVDYWPPPHLRYCILSTLTPPISVLLFIKTGPLKFWIWILSMICRSRGSLKVPVTLMLYGTPCLP